LLLLCASFFNPFAGLCGLLSAVFAIGLTSLLNYHRPSIQIGIYSFNSLLFGLGFGTFYHFSVALLLMLIVGCLLVTVLSVSIAAFLLKYNFPLLSIPFCIGFWLLLLAVGNGPHTGLEQKSGTGLGLFFSSSRGVGYSLPFPALILNIPAYVGLYFKALSAVIFQNSVIGGAIIAIGLFIHSRIQFSLMTLAFIAAVLLNKFTGFYPGDISYYNLGANIMMASGALGSFFLIPSARSYLWALLVIPVNFLLISASAKLLGYIGLPVFSLPFCVVTLLFTQFFRLRMQAVKLTLTPLQHYSPERNLYQFLNSEERLHELKHTKLNLPFMGTWMVSQGYDGEITHKEGWNNALDFVILDEDDKTYHLPGFEPSDFYCFNKPVLACADGTVEEVVAHIEDNPIGIINTTENWGNSIVIKHAEGLYSQVSHLKKNSAKVKKGDFVKQGDIIGACGSSGRSPEPHLHFQVQATPIVGSRPMAYPFGYYLSQHGAKISISSFQTPSEGAMLCAIPVSKPLKQAFNFQPGYTTILTAPGHPAEEIEVLTDAWNQSYISSSSTGVNAYFINNGNSFYFTSFYGSEKSLLFYFYLAAYKVVFTVDPELVATDTFPLQVIVNKAMLWLLDFVAPFKQPVKLSYRSNCGTRGQEIILHSSQFKERGGTTQQTMDAAIKINNGAIQSFLINLNGNQTEIQWASVKGC
jgi:urea transporter